MGAKLWSAAGAPPLSNSLIDHWIGKRRRAAALQRLPPLLTSKVNTIGFEKPGQVKSLLA
jgi:hypothetical protein